MTSLKTRYYTIFGILAINVGFLIFLAIPHLLSENEKLYMEHLNSGNSLYYQRKYKKALEEYNLAENIYSEDSQLYIYKAYCYRKQKEYAKAIENAKKALKYPDSKSIYKKAHNFKSNLNNDISAYEVIGKCAYAQKNYKVAKEAYSYIINHVTYKYTDAYLYRGICEYYLNEKQAALMDFEKHKQIINSYIYDQTNSEYPSIHPTYTNKNLVNINKWIDATNRL